MTHTTHGLSGDWGKYNKLRRTDPCEHLKHSIGVQVRNRMKKDGSIKGGSVWDFLPYSPKDLRLHLESQWEDWMTWDNYGGNSDSKIRTWWIDHIKPQSAFRFDSISDPLLLECWSLENLRPLDKIENISKGSKWDN